VANDDFGRLVARIDDRIVELFERIRVTAAGVDWEAEGLRGPSATWTYLVNDQVFGNNAFLTLANRTSYGWLASLVAWPILLLWGVATHWRRWREARNGGRPSRP
jgi:preprotein translocase subunit SecA